MSPKKSKRKYFCKCGCGGRIKIKEHHKWLGVPYFILGHNSKGRKVSPESIRKRSGKNHPNYGKHLPLAMRRKIRDKLLGKYLGKNSPNYGKHPSPLTLKKMRDKKLGKNNYWWGKHHSPKTIEKMSGENNPMYGKHPSPLTLKKNREKHLGKKASPETREKLKKHRLQMIIPRKDTSIEVKLQKALTKQRIEFRKHEPITGQPDIFIEPNICIFADGDYWHNLEKGKKRDKYVNRTLKEAGYVILRFWEHQINKDLAGCLNKISEIC